MKRRFYMRENKDSGNAFLKALLDAGYERVKDIGTRESASYDIEHHFKEADFIFMDHDYAYRPGPIWSKYLNAPSLYDKPAMLYPHTPYSWFVWDGILPPKPVLTNFVVSEGAKEAMQIYGYPYSITPVGFAGMDVKEFKPTSGTKLLFAPSHPVHDGRYPVPNEGLQQVRKTAEIISKNLKYFESVTVRHSHTIQQCGLEALEGKRNVIWENVNVYKTPNIRQSALESIERADIVISQATFMYLSVASGKPTIGYGYKDYTPSSREGIVKHYPFWRHIFYYPLSIGHVTIEDILNARKAPNPDVENWKRLNIGGNFDAKKFIETVDNYMAWF